MQEQGRAMLIRSRKSWELPYSAVTPEPIYRSRREFMRTATAGLLGAAAGTAIACGDADSAVGAQGRLTATRNAKYSVADPPNSFEHITSYNNFYEFGLDKDDPARYAGRLKVEPWSVKVDGLVGRPGTYGVDELVDFNALEERIYRLRCVEAWSMVIPWIGVPLASVLQKVEPLPAARFVEFTTVERPSEMPGLRVPVLEWPYREGLRLDEAMHPLSFMVVGLYGQVLPNQNGAPLRVHSPWKYGFKGAKSIVRIRLTDRQPRTSWPTMAPHEYGFYANVNPEVPHPRWSQARERRLPDFFARTPTLMFNGYGDEVASLYAGMDLRRNF
jgi:sulfoxide reductase catalytic subunit YedY